MEGAIGAGCPLRQGRQIVLPLSKDLAEARLDRGFGRRQRSPGPQGKRRATEFRVEQPETGRRRKRGLRHAAGGCNGRKIRQQRVRLHYGRTGMGGAGGQPEVEPGIGLARRKDVQPLRQAEGLAIEAGARGALLRCAQAAQQAAAMARHLLVRRPNLDRGASP